jgi:ethanolamine-phosphate phospho-lyase
VLNHLQFIHFPSPIAAVQSLAGYGSTNYSVALQSGEKYLVKIYKAEECKKIQEEERIISLLQYKLEICLPISAGLLIAADKPNNIFIRITRFIEGESLTKKTATDSMLQAVAASAASMLARLQNIESDIVKASEHDWNLKFSLRNEEKLKYITAPQNRKIVQHFFSVFKDEVQPLINSLRQSVVHGDLNEANIIVKDDKLIGFIDFGDMGYAPVVCELAVLLTYVMMMFPEECIEKAKLVIATFQQHFLLTEEEITLLPPLIATRLCVSVCNSAEAKALNTDSAYILISEEQAWHLLQHWISLNPLLIKNEFKQAAGYKITMGNTAFLLQKRLQVVSQSLSLSYAQPIHMQSSLFQYMYDASGGSYLDAYNNIPHVGHCHPAVVKAAYQQMRTLNTNTRYLYDIYAEYSSLLLSLFPAEFEKVMLVNSGSEASDLATRMAKTITNKKGMAILEWSYHGNTQNGINISAYKFDRKGGRGASDFILRLPLPKAYKGLYNTAEEYVADAIQRIEAFEKNGHQLAGFIAEPISGCGGQVPIMKNYLSLLAPYLKQKGILIIIDEVQTGFGRLGDFFWGFEMHGIVPDMVVLGKPIANGHPMGAVVTTSAITSVFNNGMEFFSSFGGNPVSCAIGKAVIQIIKEERLQQNAKEVGDYWQQQLQQLQTKYHLLGDVRGSGLFIGVECITDDGKENTAMAQHIKNKLKEAYILASTDGPLDNTLKMKPPLCFSTKNVDRFIETTDDILKTWR